jgi:hypothetical protein
MGVALSSSLVKGNHQIRDNQKKKKKIPLGWTKRLEEFLSFFPHIEKIHVLKHFFSSLIMLLGE